jgi:hypothetical protein
MGKILLVLASFLTLVASPVHACHRITPDRMPIEEYEAVFLGRVTGIHLVGYENSLAGEPDAHIEGLGGINFTDGSAPVTVNAVPLSVHHGNPESRVEVRLVGCTGSLPNLKDRGLFFVHAEAGSAVTVWESDKDMFVYWLERLGLDGGER